MKNNLNLLLIMILFLLACSSGYAQEKTVTGTVTDPAKLSIPGVNVIVKGTSRSTSTDFDGKYSISAAPGETLVFSFVGFVKQEVKLGANASYNVSLEAESANLNEVVVIGYGTQKKKLTSGAISGIKTETFTERPISRIDQGLIGQVAGVRVKQTTGLPGQPFSIEIRGAGSITAGNEPLYVIDGFPIYTEGSNSNGGFSNGSPLDNMNPNDVASIEVLKDASAAAIYGSRASNGVVIITTKKGKRGKPKFTFNTYGGVNKEANRVDMLSAEGWIKRAKTMIDSQWVGSGIAGASASQTTAERIAAYNAVNPATPLTTSNSRYFTYLYDDRWDMPGHPGLDYIDWQDKVFRTGEFSNYQLTASGATDAVNYYVSANYQKNTGYIIGTDYSLFSARANVDVKLSENFKMGINLAPSYSIKNDPGVEGKDNTLFKALTATPVFESASNAAGEKYTTRYAWGSSTTNMLNALARTGRNSMYRNLISGYASYQFAKSFTLKSTINFDNSDNVNESYTPNDVIASIRGAYNTYRRQNIVNENTLTYDRTFGKHSFNVLLGESFNSYQITKSTMSSGALYNSSSIETLPAGSIGSTTAEKNTLLSYFSRLQYNFKEKYIFAASIRRDGSSKFGTDRRWGTFSSLSLGWRVKQEAFLENVDWLTEFKLRASTGINGSNNIGSYAQYATLGTYNYTIGGAVAIGQGAASIPNPSLHWEESKSIDFGLDFGFIKNRLTGTFELYRKNNSELLLRVPVPGDSGFQTYLNNIGEVQNQGWEFELNSLNVKTPSFEWRTSANISHNENKVLALGSGQSKIEISNAYDGGVPFVKLEVGKPMYTIFGLKQNGVVTQADIDAGGTTIGGNKLVLGDPRYVDQNGDKKINSEDRVDLGNPTPKYTWGITNTFKYKDLDLNILVQGQNGGTVYGLTGRAIDRTGMGSVENSLNVDPAVRGNWRTSFGYQANSDWLYKSDYISVRSISIGYNLRQALKGISRIDNARLYVTGENWFYWNKYKVGFNPEAVNTSASSNSDFSVPVDYGGAPLAKSLVIGLNINFN
ncbi:SusC/RagA family TonB-linked outer membrane protein [Flavobacterium quisquiliarum]|uniref:SusC/RagA family TonB-linked outer membrane protein n=1 Tax=Flavobacterium quisquiliarum TaxID=1834436 RepID=A0ABV8W4C4_9FLAO|nr:TonB-dependent receptor [Flavobacterium quisquiliarum]MBW1655576.1 SusC/RagA family TonB-linked outer membrane protein [Flavobacterium quisquiliarum]NWL03200.1 TonB-dependent receptor [Flavobacterium collinsii]